LQSNSNIPQEPQRADATRRNERAAWHEPRRDLFRTLALGFSVDVYLQRSPGASSRRGRHANTRRALDAARWPRATTLHAICQSAALPLLFEVPDSSDSALRYAGASSFDALTSATARDVRKSKDPVTLSEGVSCQVGVNVRKTEASFQEAFIIEAMGRLFFGLLLALSAACGRDVREEPYVLVAPGVPPHSAPDETASTSTPGQPPDTAPVPQPEANATLGALLPEPPALAPASSSQPSSEPSVPALPMLVHRPGDALRGRDLVVNNGTPDTPIMSCGIPENVFKLAGLDRAYGAALKIPDRRDAQLPYDLNYVTRPSGVRLLATNCLLCHAGKLGGRLLIGLPDVSRDYTQADPLTGLPGIALRAATSLLLRRDEQVELARILRVIDVVSLFPRPDTIGLNPADGLFGALAMHRDPDTLVWKERADEAAGPIPKRIIFTDVPPWWNTHRKDALFYTGFARGDHARIIMTSALLCLDDKAEAERIDTYFPDVRAYIASLRAPRYEEFSPLPIDAARADRGQPLYQERCRRCHAGKDSEPGQPLAFVALDKVGTDPIYARVSAQGSGLPEASTIDYFFAFFNRSWYGTYGARARLTQLPQPGYPAPALDGVWATAPYFHNASVPTLEGVLDPTLRPARFKRAFDSDQYDYERVGWPYTQPAEKGGDAAVYDTSQLGNSNTGHDFSGDLSAEQRRDLLEYLKTF
jgi:mono/diheme cytochrome c family protein